MWDYYKRTFVAVQVAALLAGYMAYRFLTGNPMLPARLRSNRLFLPPEGCSRAACKVSVKRVCFLQNSYFPQTNAADGQTIWG